MIKELFFGYLSLGWKRLLRLLSILLVLLCLFGVLTEPEEVFIIALIVSPFLIIMISYVISGFVLENQKKVVYPPSRHNTTKKKQALDYIIKPKSFSLNFWKYLYFDGAYISGNKYWFRKLFQWPLILLGIGFYLRAVTTFARSRSLNLSILGSVLFSIYSFFIDIYIIVIFPINDKFIGVIDDLLWIYIIPVLPLAYLLFIDGNEKTNTLKP